MVLFSHEYIAGSKLLAQQLDEAQAGLKSVVVTDNGYPNDTNIFKDVVLVLVYCGGGGRHLLNALLKDNKLILENLDFVNDAVIRSESRHKVYYSG